MTEKHYGDARVDADQLDRRVRVADREPTGNPPGCWRRLAAVEGEGTLCLLRGSEESGRPGSNRRRPAWEAETGQIEDSAPELASPMFSGDWPGIAGSRNVPGKPLRAPKTRNGS